MTVGSDSALATSECVAEGAYVQLEISDTGRGMTPEEQARVFDPFFTTKVTGTHGLGLVGVKGIVQRLHGTIRLSSTPGKGTTFQILLPCEAIPADRNPSPIAISPEKTPGIGQITILVVEDEAPLREAVSKMLRKKGLSVIQASDGSLALDVIRAHKDHIDVLLLDITLPGASSREIYAEAKRLRPDLPVIVTSAKSEEMAAAALATGMERFLRKPFSFVELLDTIRELLSSRARTKGVATH
jgi:two-component system cell cycle sensor histidine kinase/response regulator CckA